MKMAEESESKSRLETRMYRSCLKQVVNLLNETLPPLSDSESSYQFIDEDLPQLLENETKPAAPGRSKAQPNKPARHGTKPGNRDPKGLGIYKVRDAKKKTKLLIQSIGGRSEADTRPSKIRAKEPAETEKDEKGQKGKRRNKYSEKKFNEMKEGRKEHRKNKSGANNRSN